MTTRSKVVELDFEPISCGECGCQFMMPTRMYVQRRKDGNSWYCPNGHERHYPIKTDLDKQREEEREMERQNEINRLKRERNDWQDLWNKKVIENKKLVAKKKRDDKRIHAGVCTCCNRTFQNLARHMESKHKKV